MRHRLNLDHILRVIKVQTEHTDRVTIAAGVETAVLKCVAAAAVPQAQRLRLRLAKRGYLRDPTTGGRLRQLAGPQTGKTATLSLLNSLPSGVTNKQISDFAEGALARSVAQQLIAIKLIEASLQYEEQALTRLTVALEDELGPTKGLEFHEYVRVFSKAFLEQCSDAAETIRRESLEFNEQFNWANSVLTLATLESIDRYARVLAAKSEEDNVAIIAWRDAYLRAFEARHSRIQVPDFSKRLLVSYEKIYIEPHFELKLQRSPSEISFQEMQLSGNRAVLVGDPGAGKSTAGTIIALEWVRRGQVAYFIPLRSVSHGHVSGFNLIHEIERTLEGRYQLGAPGSAIEESLLDGSALVVLDGIDEVPTLAAKLEMVASIESAARLYAASSFVVTARSIGYEQIALDTEIFTKYALKPLSKAEIKEYATKWFGLADSIPTPLLSDTIADFVEHSNPIYDMCKNPLLLALICILYRGHRSIPRRRPEIYKKCVELLLHDWDESRGVQTEISDTSMFELALMEIAHRIVAESNYQAGMPEAEILETSKRRFLAESVVDSKQAIDLAKEMLSLCLGRGWMFTAVGINDEGDDLYAFVHASLLEYFAAKHLVRTSNSPRQLSEALMPHIISGRGEILAQMSVTLAGSQREYGGPDVIERLIFDAGNLPDRESQLASGFIVNAADVVPLNRRALKKLLAHCMLLSLKRRQHSDSSRHVSQLFNPGFRHASAVPEVASEFLQEIYRKSPEVLRGLLTLYPWAWDLCLERGKLTLNEYAHLLELSNDDICYFFFRDSWYKLANSYPYFCAQWIADQFSRTGSGPWSVARAAGCMRELPRSLAVSRYSTGFFGPDFPKNIIRDTASSFDLALARTVAYPPEVVGGLVFLATRVAELVVHSRVPNQNSKDNGYVQSLIEVRNHRLALGESQSREHALVESLHSRIGPDDDKLLTSWLKGEFNFFTWELPSFGDQVVS